MRMRTGAVAEEFVKCWKGSWTVLLKIRIGCQDETGSHEGREGCLSFDLNHYRAEAEKNRSVNPESVEARPSRPYVPHSSKANTRCNSPRVCTKFLF